MIVVRIGEKVLTRILLIWREFLEGLETVGLTWGLDEKFDVGVPKAVSALPFRFATMRQVALPSHSKTLARRVCFAGWRLSVEVLFPSTFAARYFVKENGIWKILGF